MPPAVVFEVKPELEVQEDLTPYEGKWVAIRDGRVVASSTDFARLREDPVVEPGDTFVAVDDGSITFYLL